MDWNKGVQKIDKELGHEQMERLIHQGSDKCDYGNHLGAFIKFFKPLGIYLNQLLKWLSLSTLDK